MTKNRGALLLIGVFAITTLLGGCGGSKKDDVAKNTLVFAQGSEPRALDPAYSDDAESSKITFQMYEGLVRYKPGKTEVEPALATEWSVSADGKEWTFKLRKGVKFHDGTPFNAEAVKFSVDRQLEPNRKNDMPYAKFVYEGVKAVQVVDEYTVKFILEKPIAAFLANQAMSHAAFIVSPTAVKKNNGILNENPVGTGPYKFVKWEKGQYVELVAFDEYWGDKPKVKKAVYKFTKENSVRASDLISGAIDIMDGVDTNDVKKLESAGLNVIKQPGMNINYMGFYCDKGPFKDPEVRKAISMAVNRQDLIDYLYLGLAKLPNSMLPDFIPGYSKTAKPYDYNPEEAKRILAAKNLANLEFTAITYSNPRPYNPVNGEKLAAAIQAELAKIGVKMNIKSYAWTEYRQVLKQCEGDAFFYGWTGDNGDADNFLMLLDSGQIKSTLNAAHYANPEYDRLLAEGRESMDAAKRAEIYAKAQDIIMADAPWIYISHGVVLAATRPNIKDFAVHPVGKHWLNRVSKE